ncbi:3-oxo-5-alpha-steroid 4-dehydrogenase 2 isoform X1 [Lepisosteus oculatus]|uniref:3-oxo-5-alpha-steroid 4-dehydrogenase 2 isoform X1 n=1 Tax=Lepisosteus oculatus TaxID=7918 RepID=UPI00073FFEC0|nr:PREDICTED: 3-oxo-5-alpha-steroid 4-dehydrogenase 2 isoform X1 [Lepisosteus oculatus]
MFCCQTLFVSYSLILIFGGIGFSYKQTVSQAPGRYGRYVKQSGARKSVSARVAWLLQEFPAFFVPLLLWYTAGYETSAVGKALLLSLFCGHYFQRTFIYALLNKGQPFPLRIMISAAIFCTVNGFFQGHYMLYCAQYDDAWLTDIRLILGLILFGLGMAINIHSDHILRNLRKPGEDHYKIPRGGLFEYVSGANFFGEILEWFGYAVATWSLPAFSFAFFTTCSIGPRAYHHHRFYLQKFRDYPKTRKALIPFIF